MLGDEGGDLPNYALLHPLRTQKARRKDNNRRCECNSACNGREALLNNVPIVRYASRLLVSRVITPIHCYVAYVSLSGAALRVDKTRSMPCIRTPQPEKLRDMSGVRNTHLIHSVVLGQRHPHVHNLFVLRVIRRHVEARGELHAVHNLCLETTVATRRAGGGYKSDAVVFACRCRSTTLRYSRSTHDQGHDCFKQT